MSRDWSTSAVRYLLDTTQCPACGTVLREGVCPTCGLDVRGEGGQRLWKATKAAADALQLRQQIIDGLPVVSFAAPAAVAAPLAPGPVAVAAPGPVSVPRESSTSQLSVQSVLAIAGAGLVAVAAVIFTFLNPDLADFRTRTLVIGIVTVVFLGAAWLLRARKLNFSAEAVAVLGSVLAGLDVWALSESDIIPIERWFVVALGVLVLSFALIVLSVLSRMRAWAWSGMLGLVTVPIFVGLGVDAVVGGGRWWVATGILVGAALTLVLGWALVPRLSRRLETPMKFELGTLAVARVGLAAALVIVVLTLGGDLRDRALGSAALLAGLVVVALLAARVGQSRFWSGVAGVVGAVALVAVPVGLLPSDEWGWLLALAPLAVGVVVVLFARLPLPPAVTRPDAVIASIVVALVSVVPAVIFGVLVAAGYAGLSFLSGLSDRSPFEGQDIWTPAGSFVGTGGYEWTLGPVLGLAAVTLALVASRTRVGRALAPWLAGLAGVALVGSGAWSRPVQVLFGVLVVAAFAFAARMKVLALRQRALLTGAHVILAGTIMIAWAVPSIAPIAATATLLALGVLAWAMPRAATPYYVAAGYGYALLIIARALSDADLKTIVVLSLVTAIASLIALLVTLIRKVPNSWWVGILAVTVIPFVIAVGSVIAERSGWTAMSTAVTFALALTLVLSRREGLHGYVRVLAAALLVPAIAVVVICLGAQVLASSASPVTLPIIAGVVALVLPLAGLIERFFVARGLSATEASRARIAIEVSTLVTAAIAVGLAIGREAAGLTTAIIVLLIIAAGSAVAGALRVRRWSWIVAGAALTGALWCWLADLGITLPEAYILPPAIGGTVIGAGLALRESRAVALFAGGLAASVVPSLLLLAAFGPEGDTIPWRTVGLLGGAVVMTLLAAVLRRLGREGPQRLVLPLYAGAIVAAAAGPVQAMRMAVGADPTTLNGAVPVLLGALGLSAAGAVIAGVAALLASRIAARAGRATFVPALVYLIAGPIAATAVDPIVLLILWLLMLALLGVAVLTAAIGPARARLLPPVWVTWAAAWGVAVAGWSTREFLRVEAFSLPLGLALLAAALLATRYHVEGEKFRVSQWPFTASSSWQRFTPALVVVLGTSMLATFTDPRTERAILVIVLALVAVLLGSLLKQAAPFILGVLVLPIENVIAFAVQIGTNIAAMPWWITLATAGAALLVIAVTYERRASSKGVGARLRDLR